MKQGQENALYQAANALGFGVESFELASGGYTPALRARVCTSDGRRVFLKAATDALTAHWLRLEIANYRALEGASFMPLLLDAHEGEGEDDLPALLLEDLGDAYWPPAWRDGDVELVLDALGRVASWPIPEHLAGMHERASGQRVGWEVIADDPAPFLSLGLCDEVWLERALPSLLDAQAVTFRGEDALVHLDVRSDNLCVHPERGVLLIDWNWAARGDAVYDIAFWLPSLRLEDGPNPWEVLADAGHQAAAVSGFFCANAGLPPIPTAPRVRPFQLAQARVALAWVVRELDLEPL